MMLKNMCEALDRVALRQRRISHVRQYIPPDSMRTFSRRRYRTPPLPMMELPAKPARPSKRSALFMATRSALAHIRQSGRSASDEHKIGKAHKMRNNTRKVAATFVASVRQGNAIMEFWNAIA